MRANTINGRSQNPAHKAERHPAIRQQNLSAHYCHDREEARGRNFCLPVIIHASRCIGIGLYAVLSHHLPSGTSSRIQYYRGRSKLKISAVIPVYNEEEVIDEFSNRLVRSLQDVTRDYEVIFIVEGSDATLEKLTGLSKQNSHVKVEYNTKRLGLGKATKKGLGLVGHDSDYVLIMDADLNHQPEEIRRLVDASRQADIVVGSRSRVRGLVPELPFQKRVISASTNWILRKRFGVPSSDVTSGFRLYSVKAIESVRDELVATNFEVTAEILIRAKKKGFSMVEVPITFTPRPRGVSKLSFLRSGIGYVFLLLRLGF